MAETCADWLNRWAESTRGGAVGDTARGFRMTSGMSSQVAGECAGARLRPGLVWSECRLMRSATGP